MTTLPFVVSFAGLAVLLGAQASCLHLFFHNAARQAGCLRSQKDRKARKEITGLNVLVPMPHFSNPYARSENKQTTTLSRETGIVCARDITGNRGIGILRSEDWGTLLN